MNLGRGFLVAFVLTGLVAPLGAAEPATVWKESGLEFSVGATSLSVFNGSPLSYTPFEIGWRFDNGLHLRSGIDIFYYEGLDTDGRNAAKGVQLYSYDMLDWRSSLLYTIPLPGHIRPLAGLTFEATRGDRKLAGYSLLPQPKLEAWSFLGAGVLLGGEWRITEGVALELTGRYTFSFGPVGAVTGLGLNFPFLF